MVPKLDKVAFSIFGIDVMWYGILIGLGFLLGLFVATKNAKKENISEDTILDLMIIALPSSIIGARIYYVIFSLDEYINDPIQIFNLRQGGLAIYGGLIAAFIAGYFFCKKKNIKFLKMADIVAPAIALGQGIGRWGNFINQEAFGSPTNLPWGVLIDGQKYHPTFLYESLGDFAIFAFLMYFFHKRKKVDGQVISLYMILYGILRFLVEGLRMDSLYIGSLRVSQIVSLILVISGMILFIKFKKNYENNKA